MQKFLDIILDLLVCFAIVIVLFVGYTCLEISILKKPYANLFGYTLLVVKTGSMENTIKINDLVIVKIENNDLKENDIISYSEDKYIITHRITKIENGKITTKGDNNNAEDDPISRSDVIGKVIKIIPSVGIWERVFKTRAVLISIIVTVILFIISLSIKTEGEKNDTEK